MVDYTEQENHWLIAQGDKSNFLSIEKLNKPEERNDKKQVSYLLEYRWLSTECERKNDEAYVCVLGSERQFYSKKELVDCGVLVANGKVKEHVNLFDCFNLF